MTLGAADPEPLQPIPLSVSSLTHTCLEVHSASVASGQHRPVNGCSTARYHRYCQGMAYPPGGALAGHNPLATECPEGAGGPLLERTRPKGKIEKEGPYPTTPISKFQVT
jgi:hypothetical protein